MRMHRGRGLSIVLACDFAVAARSAQLGSATLRMGWQADEGGHWLLVQHMGVKRTLDFLMNKRIVTSEEARDLGLVNEVVENYTYAIAPTTAGRPTTDPSQRRPAK